jgi:uncharacterized membrane protein
MLPTKFRRQLRREADLWTAEGLIDRDTHDRLADRYQFSALDIESRNSLVTLLLGIGCVLIGIGMLTFVSANWQQLARGWRVAILLSFFVATNVAGFYLWREPDDRKQRFGQGLLLLGALILGGNMALMGQMFHVRGELFQLLIAWAVGVLLMAYSLRITSLGILAQILMGLGYWQAYSAGIWSSNSVNIDPNWTYFIYQHMSIAATCLFLPLAYWCRSKAVFTLTGIAFVSALPIFSQTTGMTTKDIAITNILLPCIPPLLLWGYGNLSQWWQSNSRDKTGDFGKISRKLAVLFMGTTYFVFSFIQINLKYNPENDNVVNTQSLTNWNMSSVSWDLWVITLVTITIWLYLLWQARNNSRHYPWDRMTTGIVSISCVMAMSLISMRLDVTIGEIFAPIIFRLLLFSVSIGLIRSGLANSDRGAFWFGLSLLVGRIIIWFLMTQNDLITKSLLFIICGIGIIAVGLWFEHYVRHLKETKVS